MTIPLLHVEYGQTGNSTKPNNMGMREMQAKAFAKRDAQYLLLKAPPASGKSRALMFLALGYALTIKLRKSPFDLSYSHHAHQELVKGVTTEMSGRTLAKVEVMHWAESVLFLAWIGMFFVWGNLLSLVLALAVALAAWFLEILIDNNFARVKWQAMLKWAWIVAFVTGGGNLVALMFL